MTNCETTSETPSVSPSSSPRASLAARAMRRLVHGYQIAAAGRLSRCRFYPSCSQYALEALGEHGAIRGGALAARRLLRCRPFGPHGVDLVPLPRERSEP